MEEIETVKDLIATLKSLFDGKINDVSEDDDPYYGVIDFEDDYFGINYSSEEALLVNSSCKSEEKVEALTLALNKLFGDTPICSYDLCYKETSNAEEETTSVIEWNASPKARLKVIVNGIGFNESRKFKNLVIFKGGKIEDFIETEEEKAKRLQDQKIYGVYPGVLCNTHVISKYNEFYIYINIKRLLGIIEIIEEHDPDNLDLIDEYEYAINFCVNRLRDLGYNLPNPDPYIQLTESRIYLEWFELWESLNETLNLQKMQLYASLKSKGYDVASFLPRKESKMIVFTCHSDRRNIH